jgi:predicted nucleic acid-binding protein
LYVDTNIFLDFYQEAHDRIGVFRDLREKASYIVLTEQTVKEFMRNRSARLVDLAKRIQAKSSPQLHYTSVVRELPGFDAWEKARDAANIAAKQMSKTLTDWAENPDLDLVLDEFKELSRLSQTLPTTNEAIGLAQRRKLLGEPPTSPDKHTVGDELIWETLLAGVEDDLIIVSRDNTFLDNQAVLAAEFVGKKRRKLTLVTKSLSEALKSIGAPSAKIENAEVEVQEGRRAKAFTYLACPNCGKEMEPHGFEGGDGSEAGWLYCRACGYEDL